MCSSLIAQLVQCFNFSSFKLSAWSCIYFKIDKNPCGAVSFLFARIITKRRITNPEKQNYSSHCRVVKHFFFSIVVFLNENIFDYILNRFLPYIISIKCLSFFLFFFVIFLLFSFTRWSGSIVFYIHIYILESKLKSYLNYIKLFVLSMGL